MNGNSNEASTFLLRFEQSIIGLENRIRLLEDRLARAETSFTNKEEKCKEHQRQLMELYEARNATNLRFVPVEQMLKEEWKTGNFPTRFAALESRLTLAEKRAEEIAKATEGVGKLQDNVEGIKIEKKETKEQITAYRMMLYTGIFGVVCSILTALATYYILGK
jgi:chromosome segregation ATPase